MLLLRQGSKVMGRESPVLFRTKLYSSSDKRGREAGMDWLLTLFSMDEICAPYQLLNSHAMFLNGTAGRSFSTVIGLSWAVLGLGSSPHKSLLFKPMAAGDSSSCHGLPRLPTYWDDW